MYYLDRLDQSIISYSNVACEDRIVRDGGGDLPTRVDSKEVILAVDVFHPARVNEPISFPVQSNLSYPGALGLGGALNSDLSVSQNVISHRL